MRLLYTITIFLSALLLFIIQPLFARMILPLLGGSAAVWNTALIFYQAILLLGYMYAHGLTRYARPKLQVMIHMGVLALALVSLPIALPAGWQPPTESSPILWVLGLLLIAIGLPFFAISASSPLLQAWFTRSNTRNLNPYTLYAASNIGSMLGLLGYPLLIEPNLTLSQQSTVWAIGYIGLIGMFLLCGSVLWRFAQDSGPQEQSGGVAPTWAQRGRWVLYAAVPSALLISVTTYISTDIAPIPLLWILPLSLYLLTFIIIFGPNPRWTNRVFMGTLIIGLVGLGIINYGFSGINLTQLLLTIICHLLVFFSATMVLHNLLASRRPEPAYLTEFYMWMSLGGVVGGTANSLLAPLLFNRPIEYTLTLILALVLMLGGTGVIKATPLRRRAWISIGLAGIMLGALLVAGDQFKLTGNRVFVLAVLLGTVGFLLTQRRKSWQIIVSSAVLISIAIILKPNGSNILYTGRNFFGSKQVVFDPVAQVRMFMHGTTIHGKQSMMPGREHEILTYYTETGPFGQIFNNLPSSYKRVGIVGLGAGSAACYRRPDQTWTFYEIDPIIIDIATDPRYFTLMSTCTPEARIIAGDARLNLQHTNEQYDLMMLDAYNSDAIPVHLITREAMQLYLNNLAPDGIMMFHITNRYFNLEPVLANLAADAGLVGRIEHDTIIPAEQPEKAATRWIIMARSQAVLDQVTTDPRWQPVQGDANPVWTDDYSSVLRALR